MKGKNGGITITKKSCLNTEAGTKTIEGGGSEKKVGCVSVRWANRRWRKYYAKKVCYGISHPNLIDQSK